MAALAVLALAVLATSASSRRLKATPVTAPMLYVAVGLLTGPEVADLARFDLDSDAVIVLAEATLATVLFTDAVRIDPRLLRRFVGLPARMLGLGLPMVMGLGTLVFTVLLAVSWERAALIAAILAATDAALGQAVLTDGSVPARIRASLNVESGLNDGLALPAVTAFTAIAIAADDGRPTSAWVRFVAEQIGFGTLAGIVVGCAGGWLLSLAASRRWVDHAGAQLGTLALVALAFTGAHALHGNTFVAAFVAGLAFRVTVDQQAENASELGEDVGQLLAAAVFVVFGSALVGPALGELDLRVALAVAFTLTIGRMAPIAASLLGTGLRAPSIAFLGWFGPRGLASVLFALFVLEEEAAEPTGVVFVVVAWTVLVSIVVHGATAAAGARRYGSWYEDHLAAHRAATDGATLPTEGPMEVEDHHPRPRWTRQRREDT